MATEASYLEIILTVSDSSGLATTITRRVEPKQVTVSFTSNPAGMQIDVNSFRFTTPFSVTSWEAYVLNVGAAPQAGPDGRRYQLQNWNDSASTARTIVTPASAASYTANFVLALDQPIVTLRAATGAPQSLFLFDISDFPANALLGLRIVDPAGYERRIGAVPTDTGGAAIVAIDSAGFGRTGEFRLVAAVEHPADPALAYRAEATFTIDPGAPLLAVPPEDPDTPQFSIGVRRYLSLLWQ